jgi:hypothetical protein
MNLALQRSLQELTDAANHYIEILPLGESDGSPAVGVASENNTEISSAPAEPAEPADQKTVLPASHPIPSSTEPTIVAQTPDAQQAPPSPPSQPDIMFVCLTL